MGQIAQAGPAAGRVGFDEERERKSKRQTDRQTENKCTWGGERLAKEKT